MVLSEGLKRLWSKTEKEMVPGSAKECQQSLSKYGYIFGPLMQGRDLDLNYIEPIKEVFPEPSFFDCFIKIPVGGSDNADIRFSSCVISYSFILFILKKAQKFRL